MKKVLLRYYPTNNLGDDLFVNIITKRYKNKFTVILKSRNTFFDKIDNLNVQNNIFYYFSFRVFEILFKKKHVWLRTLAKKHDLMVYAGGSIFIENSNLSSWIKEKDFFLKSKIPYYILGSNFGPYRSPEFIGIVSNILKNARDVCFRDRASYEIFDHLKTVRSSTDIVFSLDISKYNKETEKRAIFSIIECGNRFDKVVADKYELEIINMTNNLIQDGYQITYMSFCKYEGDEGAIQNIVAKLDKNTAAKIEIYNYDGDLEEALTQLAGCEVIIAGRFHAAILGLLFSKKVVPMAYSDKTINILHDLKFKGDIVDIRKIDKFNGAKFDFDSLQVNNVEAQIKLAEKQFKELDKVLVKK